MVDPEKAAMLQANCGCIVLNTPDLGGRMIVIRICDGEREGDEAFLLRDMSGKTFEPVPRMRAHEIIRQIQRLLGDGYRLRSIRSLLKE